MKHIPAFIWAILLAGALSACVPAKQHEDLKAQHRELRQTLQTKERSLYNARKDHRTVVSRLEADKRQLQQQLSETRTQLTLKQEDLEDLRRKYKIASDELSKTAANSLALIEEKKQLNATIIELQGTISTLRDTVKDLQDRLDEAAAAEAQPGLQGGPGDQPSKVPQ